MKHRSTWTHRLALAALIAAALASAFFAIRTYRSFQLLQSAYAVGAPKTSSVRGWMTLRYVAGTYRIAEAALREGLALAPDTDADKSLKALADELHVAPPQYVQRVQRVIAERAPAPASDRGNATSGWFAALTDRVLTGLLVYGYSALGLTVLFASIGLPLPDGLAMALAGSLAGQGRIDWLWAGAVAVIASVLGDFAGYGIGRVLSEQFLAKRGQWIGYTPARRARVDALFERWGLMTVFITRTFVSYLSSVANIFAGVSRFGAGKFLVVAIVGRLIWTAAYMGLGYVVGADLEAAAAFLTNLSLLLLCLVLSAGSAWLAFVRPPAPA
jgi:membrane protein DedA with SNARE-associated domain